MDNSPSYSLRSSVIMADFRNLIYQKMSSAGLYTSVTTHAAQLAAVTVSVMKDNRYSLSPMVYLHI